MGTVMTMMQVATMTFEDAAPFSECVLAVDAERRITTLHVRTACTSASPPLPVSIRAARA